MHDSLPPVTSRVRIPTSGMGTVNSECLKRPVSTTHVSGRLIAVKNNPSWPIQGCIWPRHCLSQILHHSWPVKNDAFFGVKFGPKWTLWPSKASPTAGLGRLDLPLWSFKHAKGSQAVLRAHKHTPTSHLTRTGGSSASEVKVTARVAVLATNTSVHGSRLYGHQ